MDLTFMAWTEEFAVGHESLDLAHHCLIDRINEVHSAECAKQSPSQMRPLLGALNRMAADHFQHENSVLNRINFGPLPSGADERAFLKAVVGAAIVEHTASHKRSLHQLNTIIRDFYAGLGSVEQDLSLDLKAWFIDHAVKYDAHLREVFKTLSGRAV